jgi:ribosomal peptide maturation radical SAM protein 1
MFDETSTRARRAAMHADVELVSMPWTSLKEPSLGLGILSAVLAEAGLSSRVRHLNLTLLRYLRSETYAAIADTFALNDFLFTGLLDPVVTTRQWGWLRQKATDLVAGGRLNFLADNKPTIDVVIDNLLDMRRNQIPTWLDEQASLLAGSPAPLVGFTCMFDQTIASVALAHMVKERAPEKLIALGGYAVRQPTGGAILSAFRWIDAVCTGEGETMIAQLARAAASELSLAEVPGLAYREPDGESVSVNAPAPMVDLAQVPTPNYDDFYLDIADLATIEQIDIATPRLPVENSRGCWWGEIRHCVFCGINDEDLKYRAKPADVAMRTMDDLAARYGVCAFRFSDYILPRSYFNTLLPQLMDRGAPYQLTAEMKANVSSTDFALLTAAGFVEVQPGIESFSMSALTSMDKGTSPIQNAHTLLLGRANDVKVNWNLLYGFPDDDPNDYELMLETLSRLTHLDPPATRLEVQVTRYAPMQVNPGRFGIPAATYEPSYDLVFSECFLARTGFNLSKYCYFFARPFQNSVRLERIYRRIDALVDHWSAATRQRKVSLEWRNIEQRIVVTDTRLDPSGVAITLDEAQGMILMALRTPRSVTGLARHGLDLDHDQVIAALSAMDRLGLVLRDGNRWLSLVLPADRRTSTSHERETSKSSISIIVPNDVKLLPITEAASE